MTAIIKKKSAQALIALGLSLTALGAQAVPTTELALGIDTSSSISLPAFDLQRDAYQSVLSDSKVLPQDGSVAVSVWSFGTDVENVFPLATIDSSNVGGLVTAVGGILGGGATALGPAIQAAANELINSGNQDAAKVIDISTDGDGNVGIGEDDASANAIAAGIDQVNCIGVGFSADCGFTAGAGSFSVAADDFDAFEQSLRNKIVRETSTAVPAPTTLTLLIAGLAGFAARSRKRSA